MRAYAKALFEPKEASAFIPSFGEVSLLTIKPFNKIKASKLK
jgi:hypothetical protein